MDGINNAAMRDANGRFAPGISGNPAGKKPGTRNGAAVLRKAVAEGEDIAAAGSVSEKALAGAVVAARFVVDRLPPAPRGRAIALDLPGGKKAADVLAASNATIAAMASGEITPDEALTVTKVLDGRLRALKLLEREKRAGRQARQKPPSPLAGEGRGEGAASVAPTQLRRPPHPPLLYAIGP